jgi:hypothetical protein
VTKANPAKAGDAKLGGYRTRSRATPVQLPKPDRRGLLYDEEHPGMPFTYKLSKSLAHMKAALAASAALALAGVVACRTDTSVEPTVRVCDANCGGSGGGGGGGGTGGASVPAPRFRAVALGGGDRGNLQVILLGASDGFPYLIWQSFAEGTWHWYGRLPNPNGIRFRAVATGNGDRGNLQVVLVGESDGLPYLIWQSHSDGTWHWYGKLPNPNAVQLSAVATGVLADFYKVDDSHLWMPGLGATDGLPYAFKQYGGGNWAAPAKLPGSVPLSSLASIQLPGGDVVPFLFGVGAADKLPYEMEMHSTYCGSYNDSYRCTFWRWDGPMPNPAGVQLRTLTAAFGDGGRAQVIGLGASDSLPYLIWKDHQRTWHWAGKLPNPYAVRFGTATASNGDRGNLQLLLLGSDKLPYLIWQAEANGTWHWFGKLPNPSGIPFSALAAAPGNAENFPAIWERNLQVILLGAADGLPYLIFQSYDGGRWHWYGKLPVQ